MFQQRLAPFPSRNFRLFFGGQVVSLMSSWMTQTAIVWRVYQLTHSPPPDWACSPSPGMCPSC